VPLAAGTRLRVSVAFHAGCIGEGARPGTRSLQWARHRTLQRRVFFTALVLFTKDQNDENASGAGQTADDRISNPPKCIAFGRGVRGAVLDVHDGHGANDEPSTGCGTNANGEPDVRRHDNEQHVRRRRRDYGGFDELIDASAGDTDNAVIRYGNDPSDRSHDLGQSDDGFARGRLVSIPGPASGSAPRGTAEGGDGGRSS
jgi:hypothetical protein